MKYFLTKWFFGKVTIDLLKKLNTSSTIPENQTGFVIICKAKSFKEVNEIANSYDIFNHVFKKEFTSTTRNFSDISACDESGFVVRLENGQYIPIDLLFSKKTTSG